MSIVQGLLILALLAVLAVLFTGIAGFVHGGEFNRKYGNKLMRARVGLQLLAVILLAIVLFANS